MDFALIVKLVPVITQAVKSPDAKEKAQEVLDEWGLTFDDVKTMFIQLADKFDVDIEGILKNEK